MRGQRQPDPSDRLTGADAILAIPAILRRGIPVRLAWKSAPELLPLHWLLRGRSRSARPLMTRAHAVTRALEPTEQLRQHNRLVDKIIGARPHWTFDFCIIQIGDNDHRHRALAC